MVGSDLSSESPAAVTEPEAGSSDAAAGGWLRRGLLLLLGTILLAIYLRGLDYSALLSSAEAFPAGLALAVVAINVLPGAIKYLRWRHFLTARGLGVEGFRGYLAVNASFFHGLVTPGTAGELSRAWVSESEEAGRATAVVAFEKLTDLVVLLLLVAVSAAVQFTAGIRSWAVVGAACLVVLAGYGLFLRYDGLLTTPLKFLLRRAVSEHRREALRDSYWEFYELVQDRWLVVLSVVLVLLVAVSAAVQFTGGDRSWVVVGAACLVVLAGYGLFLRYDRLLTTPLKFLLRRAVSEDRREALRDAYWEFYELVENRKLVVLSVVASSALWLVTLAQMQLIVAGLGWELPLKTTALALFLPYLAGVVSLIPLGLGVFELMMARVAQVDLLTTTVEGASIGPLFFRFLVTVPLVLGGYLCHLALTLTRWRDK